MALVHEKAIDGDRQTQQADGLCSVLMGYIDETVIAGRIDALQAVLVHAGENDAWKLLSERHLDMVLTVSDHQNGFLWTMRKASAEDLVVHRTDHDWAMHHIAGALLQEEALDHPGYVLQQNVVDGPAVPVLTEEIAVDLIDRQQSSELAAIHDRHDRRVVLVVHVHKFVHRVVRSDSQRRTTIYAGHARIDILHEKRIRKAERLEHGLGLRVQRPECDWYVFVSLVEDVLETAVRNRCGDRIHVRIAMTCDEYAGHCHLLCQS